MAAIFQSPNSDKDGRRGRRTPFDLLKSFGRGRSWQCGVSIPKGKYEETKERQSQRKKLWWRKNTERENKLIKNIV